MASSPTSGTRFRFGFAGTVVAVGGNWVEAGVRHRSLQDVIENAVALGHPGSSEAGPEGSRGLLPLSLAVAEPLASPQPVNHKQTHEFTGTTELRRITQT